MTTASMNTTIARELSLPNQSVAAVLGLLDEGNTVPFVARYRKEATGDLDEVQIRTIWERATYLRELAERRETILSAISEQGKLTPQLKKALTSCTTKAELEDLYLPYKKKRRTRATKAREAGLEPLATKILSQSASGSPRGEARAFVKGEIASVDAALQGARDIVAELVAERADARRLVRKSLRNEGDLVSSVVKKKAKSAEAARFRDWFDYRESVRRIPSHRYLAIRRGEREGILRTKIEANHDRTVFQILRMVGLQPSSPWARQLTEAVQDSFKRLLLPSVSNDVHSELKERSDIKAIEVFAENLRNLLLSPPAGGKPVIAIDPGLRTGCKAVALDHTGALKEHRTLYLVKGEQALVQARSDLVALVERYRPFAVAIGNGTGGRETEAFVRQTLKASKMPDVIVVLVSESGASVYSASDIAREEFPDLDLTIRGAVSIGRRFQDPLAELVKLDPKSIGVGQYQHDVQQTLLARKLDEVVESCVNGVGVELNTASAPLLSYVAGIGKTLAARIVAFRDKNGRFRTRDHVLKVSGLGDKTFQQAAGFLRVRDSRQPLDRSAVHPERYRLVERIAGDLGVELDQLVGNEKLARTIDVSRYVGDEVGAATMEDIVSELKKPGRDPRKAFEPPRFREDVNDIKDLKEGMKLEGVVTNVTNFGAFVDVGVHTDGLVHISQLADRFVKDPHGVVKVGQKVKVVVLSVELKRKRIGLSMKQA